MITHAVTRHGPCSKFAFPHCATLEQKICGLSHQFEETHSKSVRMPASISCQRAAISANNYRLKCLPVKRSATLVWSHVACNKKPGVKRRAYPSLLQAIDRGLRTEELDARFEPTRLTLPISPHRLAARTWYTGIRSLASTGSRVGPRSKSVALPPVSTIRTLTLKLFRRERAISTFD